MHGWWNARTSTGCLPLRSSRAPSWSPAMWVKVTDAADLLAVYNGQPPEELFYDRCDVPDWYAA